MAVHTSLAAVSPDKGVGVQDFCDIADLLHVQQGSCTGQYVSPKGG